jgi:cytochrome c oxidase subunit 4
MTREEWEDVWIWVALLLLLALTMAVSFGKWGPLSTALSFLISIVKTGLIAWFYMHLKHDKGMTRVFAVAGVAWLVIMFTLTLNDYASRSWLPYPARWPIHAKLAPSLNDR